MKKILFLVLSVSFTLMNFELIAQCSGGKVQICHSVGNACVTMCVPPNAVAAHVAHGDFIGSCSDGRLFALLPDILNTTVDFVEVNINTGVPTILLPSAASFVGIGTSTFDPINRKYYFRGRTEHVVVDINTNSVSNVPIVDNVVEYEYDANTNKIFGLLPDISNATVDFVEVDINTGVPTILLPSAASFVGIGTSTFDPINRKYYFRGRTEHVVVDINTNSVSNVPIVDNVVEYEYDANTNKIFGLLPDISNATVDFVEVDINTGVPTILLSALPLVGAGTSTFDPINRKYYYRGRNEHIVIDVSSNSFVFVPSIDNVVEYEFFSCLVTCPNCKTNINIPTNEDKEIKEFVNVYPNPSSKEISFDYTIDEKEDILSIEIYDMRGMSVAKLLENKHHKSGVYHIKWTLDDSIGNGIYFYKISSSYNKEINGKIFIIK
ncbi:MAG: T9SS type A sorting domain-containing protein [Vicingaceae bacterium]|nr:T9SS type A sorting domain-containing protein [Vicingaceae bacterium]